MTRVADLTPEQLEDVYTALLDKNTKVEGERDSYRAIAEDVLARAEAAEAREAALRAALEQVEWSDDKVCLWCKAYRPTDKHYPNCPRQLALAGPAPVVKGEPTP